MSKPFHHTINYFPLQDLWRMKTVAIIICLIGTAFAIPTEDIHPETPNKENVEYVDKGDFLPSDKTLKTEVSVPDAERKDEPQTSRKQERTGSEHQAKNRLKSRNFHALHNTPSLASDNRDSDSGSSGEQSSSEHYQFRSHEKHSNAASQDVLGNVDKTVDALSLHHQPNKSKHNKNTIGLSERNSKSDEGGEGVEKEDDEWSEETDYRDTKHKGHQMTKDNQYKRQQNGNSMQSDEILGDSSQSIQTTRRHSEKSDLEEEEREQSQKQPYKEATPLSQNTQDQDDKWQRQDKKDNIQANYQSEHDTVVKRQDTEDSNVDDDEDSGDVEGEEDLSNVWKVAAYEAVERIQSNNQDSTSTEHEGEGITEDDTAVPIETKDYQNVKIKGVMYSEQDDYHHEPLNSVSKPQSETSAQSTNLTQSEDKVQTTDSFYGEMESASNRSEKALLDTCRNFHCKRGRICHVDKHGKPSCICQDPATCPPTKDYEHVCGTDNRTYDGMCQLFGTKCQLQETKTGHQLHLDYMGSCKYIPHCTDYEVNQFPLRMRDWLKNVLMQYYESDQDSSGFLTEKQRNKVKKIYQNDKRLVAGNHTVELLLHDFEKNYHMYVYPVHWQFHQLDQQPVDRLLTHSELASLRASLVPLEHCITRFFQECDGDHDKLIALREWCQCFEIKKEDINENLLF